MGGLRGGHRLAVQAIRKRCKRSAVGGISGIGLFIGGVCVVLEDQEDTFVFGVEFEQVKGVVSCVPCVEDGGFFADSGFVKDLEVPEDECGEIADVIDDKNGFALGFVVVVDKKTAGGLFGTKTKARRGLFEVDPCVSLDEQEAIFFDGKDVLDRKEGLYSVGLLYPLKGVSCGSCGDKERRSIEPSHFKKRHENTVCWDLCGRS